MGMLFESYQVNRCCLCGSSENLTGEHKIKASALRKIFGKDAMFIGSFDGTSIPRRAQGPGSDAFHFSARMCALCNNARTQAPDLEFDRFHDWVSKFLSEGKDPGLVFSLPRYDIGSEPYLNVFRYFAKILCCHVAESYGPRPLAVSEFAIGRLDHNFIFLNIDADPLGEHKFAGHGGLMSNPTSLRTSLSLGATRYSFGVRFGAMPGITLRILHHDFWKKCDVAYLEFLKSLSSDDKWRRLDI